MSARVIAFIVLCFACDQPTDYYLYTANPYEPQRDCVDSLVELDVEVGKDPGNGCAAVCVVGTDYDGGPLLFASTECGPAPHGADVSGSNVGCPAALAALSRADFCLDGGGSTNPLDAGAD
jgi:hypothetical protein